MFVMLTNPLLPCLQELLARVLVLTLLDELVVLGVGFVLGLEAWRLSEVNVGQAPEIEFEV